MATVMLQGHEGAAGRELLRVKGALQFGHPSIVDASFALLPQLAQPSGTIGSDYQSASRDGHGSQEAPELANGHVDDVQRV